MKMKEHRPALWALLLSMPIPTLGVWLGMFVWPASPAGELAFTVAKFWVLAFPLAWLFYHYRRISWPPINTRGLGMGFATGIIMFVVILGTYVGVGSTTIDSAELKAAMQEVGLFDPKRFLLLALYWTFVNALLEEYFWRWFIVSRANSFMPQKGAILLSAFGFVAHHFLAMSLYFDLTTTLLACVGIFVAGIVWSAIYVRYSNILSCYISHIFADTAIFGIGYYLLFM